MWKTLVNAFRQETQQKQDQDGAAVAEMQSLEGRTMCSASPFAPGYDAGTVSDLGAVTRPQIIGILIAL